VEKYEVDRLMLAAVGILLACQQTAENRLSSQAIPRTEFAEGVDSHGMNDLPALKRHGGVHVGAKIVHAPTGKSRATPATPPPRFGTGDFPEQGSI
jgi:hypothetical protein